MMNQDAKLRGTIKSHVVTSAAALMIIGLMVRTSPKRNLKKILFMNPTAIIIGTETYKRIIKCPKVMIVYANDVLATS